MKILFVCKYNRFRSQVADAYFRKINKNKKIKSYSAGIIMSGPIAKSVKQIGKKLGLKISGKPKGINEKLLKDIDLLVVVADNVSASMFKTRVKRVLKWDIPDTSQEDLQSIERISKTIIKRVDVLVKSLEKRKWN